MSQAQYTRWYDLFSRGARDWLRHNEKLREAVKGHLPDLVSGADILSGSSERTVRVPVRMLEHYRFRLREEESDTGVGQGKAKPGDVISNGREEGQGGSKRGGGDRGHGVELLVEFRIDEIVDWLWEELELPQLRPRLGGTAGSEDYVREGIERHGPRARLDRRATLREAVRRRHVQGERAVPFTSDDLRYRPVHVRPKPLTRAVVFFLLDVSASMGEQDRRLAKTFFFWALQGLRRRYREVEIVFVAHTVEAWEFGEEEFFKAAGHGGTVASVGFNRCLDILKDRYDPSRYNVYLFYASDGENFPEDRSNAARALASLTEQANFAGYLEIATAPSGDADTETTRLFAEAREEGAAVATWRASEDSQVWDAIRAFFRQEAEAA